MRNKKTLMLTILIILYSFLTLLASNGFSHKLNLNVEDWLKYRILASSDTENMFVGNWPPSYYYGNWSVIPEDWIMFNVSSVISSEINGTLFLGNTINNTIFYNVRNIDVAFALSLSIYPWNGGFFANESDWDNIELQVQETNTTINNLSNFEHTLNGTTHSYEVKIFNTKDYYGQNSSFYYHSDTGILLKAYTSYGLYELNITLVSTSIEINPTMQTTGYGFNLAIVSIALIPVILLFRRKYFDRK
ncbi:MAG: hypothetical protein ACFFDS_00215 [Candidatus Thorarchaeota archaeon]